MVNTESKLSLIEKACEDKKAINTEVLEISKFTSIADYFVITSGNSSTQVQSIADEIEDQMKKIGYEEVIKEGYQSARWILIDLNDVVVHIFHKDERDHYNLERLWRDMEEKNNTKEE